VNVLHGDMLAILPTLEADSFDAVVTDPPYHLTDIKSVPHYGKGGFGNRTAQIKAERAGFMGKEWDGGDVAFRPETWAEVLRVLKPGAFMVCFASTRGYHRMVCAIEDAGFLVHPMLAWITAQGFPKATRFDQPELDGWRYGLQALKPAIEPICMAQKPMERGLTGSQNWAKHGVGGINIEASRVGYASEADKQSINGIASFNGRHKYEAKHALCDGNREHSATTTAFDKPNETGRWPANLCHDGSPEVMAAFAAFGTRNSHDTQDAGGFRSDMNNAVYGQFDHGTLPPGRGDTGSAARFFFSAKASKADRADSKHPTVKPLALMRWLVTLITPPGGRVLDPFAGSGITAEACMTLGFDCTLVDIEADHVRDIRHRVARWSGLDTPLFIPIPPEA
jgi:site-specific DNA-methyltransferase (adenine-specific)